ncbi:LysR family transcriptional regulator [Bifidobacterium thermophilum]|nr:LysR family transcriptional regulator [Bifidobacterium thermophilum]
MIETYLLEQFVAFARCGTLLKASEELYITQPTLSRSMKKLEKELGVSIFHRENSKLSLNETGKVAAEYAEKALQANQDLIDHVLAYDRNLRTVSVGSSSPFPINELMAPLQEYLTEKTILTELVDTDEQLLTGLKNRRYDIIILHSFPEDKALYCQRYMDEQIYLTVDENHPFSKKKSISFAQMHGMRILVSGKIGFWMDICKKHLSESDLLIQTSPEALGELIEASALPFFNSDRMLEMGYQAPGRVSIPINDEDAHATYWAACRTSDQNKYRAIFNAVRSYTLRHEARNSR